MKKIIAAAVAASFVAPMAFAEATVSGVIDMSYVDQENRTAANTTKKLLEDSTLTISASQELGNGMSIAGNLSLNTSSSVTNNDGSKIVLSGPFGKLGLGDNAGAIDGVDEIVSGRSVNARSNDDAQLGGGDAGVRWDLPAIMDGLSVALTANAKNDNPGNAADDGGGASVKYAFGPVAVAYAQEDIGSTEISGYSGSATFGGLMVGAESWTSTTAAVDTDLNILAGSYTMGDIKIAYSAAQTESASVDLSDVRTIILNYTMGPGVTLFVESADEKVAVTAGAESTPVTNKKNVTAVGIEYKF